ncbi:MAG: TusE/DsrC/DsvC family sulfur relay protein [Gammaproteobacteria bacterium]|nr:TusE/DsrC/DsvC family sulfur relay protein [Gammaproteobacteria bacterium]
MYPNMQTKELKVNGKIVLTCSEGYIVHQEQWSEDFVRAQAAAEKLELTDEVWEVVFYLRSYFEVHGVQAEVRKIAKYFRSVWGEERGNSTYLHKIFPYGGPQKQGNRLAGLMRTKGEH